MKLSEKISQLRQSKGLTQEDLAAICNVSRQSISKWEADIALPEIEKLLILSNAFQVPLDVLLKDDLAVNSIKDVHTCGDSIIQGRKEFLYEGILIKESLADENVLDDLTVHKIELWNTGGKPKYWTVLFFTSAEPSFPEHIRKAITPEDNWFVDFKADNVKYVVFHDLILKYTIGNAAEKEAVRARCRELGIPDAQLQWPE